MRDQHCGRGERFWSSTETPSQTRPSPQVRGTGSGPRVGVVAEGDYHCGRKRAAWPETAAMPHPRPYPRERGTRRRGASRSGGTARRGSTGGRICA
jgi:hypothetical protein